jgi:hypothetical protein
MSLATESGEKLGPRMLSREYFECNRVAEAGDGPIIIWLFGKDSTRLTPHDEQTFKGLRGRRSGGCQDDRRLLWLGAAQSSVYPCLGNPFYDVVQEVRRSADVLFAAAFRILQRETV